MTMNRILRTVLMVTLSMALALGLWGVMPAQRVVAEACSTAGDYRTAASGNWNATATWEYCDGSDWVAASATPTFADGEIVIRNGHIVAVTANVTVDQLTIQQGGQLTVDPGSTLSTYDGDGHEIVVYGTFLHRGGVANPMNGSGSLESSGVYIHNTTGSAARMVDFFGDNKAADSTWVYLDSGAAVSMSGKLYGNLVFETVSSWQTGLLAGALPTTINGNLTIGAGVQLRKGSLVGLELKRDWINNGIYTPNVDPTIGVITFNGTTEQTIGGTSATAFNNLTVNSGATVVVPLTTTVVGTVTNNGTLQQTQDVNGSTDVNFFNTGGYGGLTINASGSDLGSTVVSIKGNQACDTDDTAVHRCFDIAPATATGRNATITFYYDSAELNSLDCDTMNAWHWSGALPWIQAGTSGTRQCTTDPYSLQVTGVTTFSPFALRSGAAGPTSVGSVALSGSASWLPIGMLLLAGLVVLRKRK